jgi:predicted Zn-dependent peptidase
LVDRSKLECVRLDNGVTVLAEIMPGAPCVAAGVFVRVGSRDEPVTQSGVSHFLEHMIFRGDCTRSAGDIHAAFRAVQARARGFASEECTAYYAFVPAKYQLQLLRLWADLMKPALRPSDIEEEKAVVMGELEDRMNDPRLAVTDLAKRLHFGEHECGRSVLGTRSCIEQLTDRNVREHHRAWYVPSHMVLACAGGVNWDELVAEAEASFKVLPEGVPPGRDPRECSGAAMIEHVVRKDVEREHICIVSAAPSAQSRLSYASWVLADAIGGGVASYLHRALVTNELADRVESKYDALDGAGAYYTYVSCHPRNAGRVVETVRRVYGRIRAEGIGARSMIASKRKLIRQISTVGGMPQGRLAPMAFGWLYRGRHLSVKNETDIAGVLGADDVQTALENYPLEHVTIASLGPLRHQVN